MNFPKGTILLAEDEHDIRVAVRACLESVGCQVVSATNGVAALALLDTMEPPLAIVLDLNMPLMDGRTFLKKLQARSELARVPVIQISATNEKTLAGARCSLRKPLDMYELLTALQKCLEASVGED